MRRRPALAPSRAANPPGASLSGWTGPRGRVSPLAHEPNAGVPPAAPPAATSDRVFVGIALMLGFCVVAPLIDVASKLATQAVPVGTVTLEPFVVQGLLMAPIVALMGIGWGLSGRALRLMAARALASILATYCFVAAVQVMPIADALAIAFVEPFVILLIGHFVLREEVSLRRLGAATVGFIGALFVIQPSFSQFGAVAIFPLGTAVAFALSTY